MPKILVNWEHAADRNLERVELKYRSRVQKVIDTIQHMQAPASAKGHYSWHVDIYENMPNGLPPVRVATIIFRGITARTVYGAKEKVPNSPRYKIRKIAPNHYVFELPEPAKTKEISLLQEVFQEADNELDHMVGGFSRWADKVSKSKMFTALPLIMAVAGAASPTPSQRPIEKDPVVLPPPTPLPPRHNPVDKDFKDLNRVAEEERKRKRREAEERGKLPKKTPSGGKPNGEVSIMQEVFQEADEDWISVNGYYYNGYNSNEFENEEQIPPTLRSPGVPPPPPPTRREGQGQLPLPLVDSEPPTVRLPRGFAPYKSAASMPIKIGAQTQSIRREYEMPLMDKIFTEAEDEFEDNYIQVRVVPGEQKMIKLKQVPYKKALEILKRNKGRTSDIDKNIIAPNRFAADQLAQNAFRGRLMRHSDGGWLKKRNRFGLPHVHPQNHNQDSHVFYPRQGEKITYDK